MVEPRKIIMPVDEERALRQFELEALRQITDNLKRLNDKSDKHGDVLQAIEIRLGRIEDNKLGHEVETLKAKVDALEADKHRRDGAIGMASKAPGLITWLISIGAAIVGAVGAVGWMRGAP